MLPESTTIVEYLGRPRSSTGLQARLWDRVIDGQVMTPMQKIVADSLRPEGERDPYGVDEARATLDRAYALLDDHSADDWLAGPSFTSPTAGRPGALLRPRRAPLGRGAFARLTDYFDAADARPSVARVIEEARPYRAIFPLPWPDYVAVAEQFAEGGGDRLRCLLGHEVAAADGAVVAGRPPRPP